MYRNLLLFTSFMRSPRPGGAKFNVYGLIMANFIILCIFKSTADCGLPTIN